MRYGNGGATPVELLDIDPVGTLNLAIEPWRRRLHVDVADAAIEKMPVKGALELSTIVGLNDLDLEWQLLEEVVRELDCRLLIVAWVDP